MKNFLSLLLFACSFSSWAQTGLFTPTGTVTGPTTNSSTGYVGVGTLTPAEQLHINGNIRGNQSGALRINTGNGYVDVGPQNTGYSHFQTDRPLFYFNKPVTIDGELTRYGAGNTVRIGSTASGYVDVGPQNGSYCHFQTDRPQFYFNKPLAVQGSISSYGGDLQMAVNGVTQLSILQANGNVGIGTTSPGSLLHLLSSSTNGTVLRLVSASSNGRDYGIGSNFITANGEFGIYDYTANSERLRISNSGNLGVGTSSPLYKTVISNNGAQGIELDPTGVQLAGGVGIQAYNRSTSSYVPFQIYGSKLILGGGYVGIGTTNPDALLTVSGQVHAQEVKVTVNAPGPDYVFEKDYKLSSLEEIKNYIDQNKHLPEVPSAKEMEKNGIQLGEMNMLMLKKIEELTLYVIEQNKKMEILSEKVKTLETNK